MAIDIRKCPCYCKAPRRYAVKVWRVSRAEIQYDIPPVLETQPDSQETSNTVSPSGFANSELGPPPPCNKAAATSSTSASPHIRWSVRVAAMPRKAPGPGFEYLSIIDERPLPVSFDTCGPCERLVSTLKPLRYLLSRMGTFAAWRDIRSRDSRSTRNVQSSHRNLLERKGFVLCNQEYYYDTDRHKFMLRVINGLGDEEIERPIRGRDDWTRYYEWALAVQHRDPCGDWIVEGRFFFIDLPRRLQFGAHWRDLIHTQRHGSRNPKLSLSDGGRKWEGSFSYSENVVRPSFAAEIRLQHKSADALLDVNDKDPWDYFSPETCFKAEMDQLTACGRYKKVLWYHRGVGYGNDLIERLVTPWDESTMKDYADFIEPLMPSQ